MEQSVELKELTLRFYDALAQGDISAIARWLSRYEGVLAIGTDPEEWWADSTTLMKAFQAQMEELGGGVPVVAGNPEAFSEGSIGWVADRPKFQLPDGAEIPFRMTLVLHREDGEWKIVQSHASLGVPNEAVIGQELTV